MFLLPCLVNFFQKCYQLILFRFTAFMLCNLYKYSILMSRCSYFQYQVLQCVCPLIPCSYVELSELYQSNPSNTTRQERLQMDIKSATSAFSNLESPIDGSSIKDCYHLGQYNAQGSCPKPLLVIFIRYTDASNLLNSKSKLSKPIHVKPDLFS